MTAAQAEPRAGGNPFPVHDPGRLLLVGLVMMAGIVALLLLEQVMPVRALVLEVDRAAHELAPRVETPIGLGVSQVLSLIGGFTVTAPLRVTVGVVFAIQRRWWHLLAWVASIALMEVMVTAMKVGIERPRPPGALEATRLAAFPSGHAGATAVTLVALLLMLGSSDPRRRRAWWMAAVAVMVVMSLSRLYLRVHWLSDVVMGLLVGSAAAVVAVASVALLAERRERPRGVRLRGRRLRRNAA